MPWRGVGPRVSRAARMTAERRGNVATMTALTMPLVLGIGAIAIDEASLYVEKREAQAITDLAAIAAASDLTRAEFTALGVLSDNRIVDLATIEQGSADEEEDTDGAGAGDDDVQVEPGRYAANPALAASVRFTPGAEPANAVRVTVRKRGHRYFAGALVKPPRITVRAVATAMPQATFSVGSRLASLHGGVLNALLGELLGGQVTLSAMDYQALLGAQVGLFSFLDALAIETDLTAVTYETLIDTEVTVADIAAAVARLPGISAETRVAANRFAASARLANAGPISLSRLLDPGPEGRRPVGAQAVDDPDFSVLTLLTAAATLGTGTNQVRVDLGTTIPGMASAVLDLAIGEPPAGSGWLAVGEQGRTVRTAQTRLLLTVTLGGSGALAGTEITVPIYVEIANAEARLADIACAGTTVSRVSVDAKPGIAELQIASLNATDLVDFSRDPQAGKARLVSAPLITVTGRARVETGNTAYNALRFDRQDIGNGTVKQVSSTQAVETLTATLIGNLDLDIRVLGIGIGLAEAVRSALASTLAAAAPEVDRALFSVLGALGIRVGEADVRVHAAKCGRAVLVQ